MLLSRAEKSRQQGPRVQIQWYEHVSTFYSKDIETLNHKNTIGLEELINWLQTASVRKKPRKTSDKDNIPLVQWLKYCGDCVDAAFREERYEHCCRYLTSVLTHFISEGSQFVMMEEQAMDYGIFKYIEILLTMAALLTEKIPRFIQDVEIIWEHMKRVSHIFAGHIELLNTMRVAHTDASRANQSIRTFYDIFVANRDAPCSSKRCDFELSCKALMALDLYMENYSPLTHEILSDKAAYDLDSQLFQWLDKANKCICKQ
ncbi:hypothetical protein RFI_14242 [Reticulomyxa filosa]|uniref:Uncharacterized protein n=1 Tax=Reticulomyxa filosa TaxID=46433 RepID=X6N9I8_RETFI|nr:hypothetical protein RFI_14242 [Reticulomyxa filosa]|eukprot:ETO22950.1 hypothetical protein RFI_14242 [Reticulomyxa filosa]